MGAKWQNGVAEGAIHIVVSRARTMMIHAKLQWPWPMAMEYAAYLYNNTPNAESGIAPIEVFSRTVSDGQALKHMHTWGCPVYVLAPRLCRYCNVSFEFLGRPLKVPKLSLTQCGTIRKLRNDIEIGRAHV